MAATPEALPEVAVKMTVASGTVVFEERKTASNTQVGQATLSPKAVPAANALPAAAQD